MSWSVSSEKLSMSVGVSLSSIGGGGGGGADGAVMAVLRVGCRLALGPRLLLDKKSSNFSVSSSGINDLMSERKDNMD